MRQSWRDLLFAHWPVDPGSVRLPAGLELDLYDGSAWMTMTPHWIRVERVASMRELSIRTYVRDGGVYFTALWTDNPRALRVARLLYRIAYERLPISLVREGDTVTFASPMLRARYGPEGDERIAREGLEEWLVERPWLFVSDSGNTYRCEARGPRWRLRDAWAELDPTPLIPSDTVSLGWCERHDVRLGRLERVA